MKIINTVGIVGAGTMGAALAQKFAQEGFDVLLNDREQVLVDKGMNTIRKSFEEGLQKKVFTEEKVKSALGRLKGTADLGEFKVCDIVIEAIYENFNAKSDLFRQLSKIVPASTILATNTSSFSVAELAVSVSHPERFIGLHFFYHAAKNRLVEIIPGERTSKETFALVRDFSEMAGKDPISCSDAYGFVVNRFFVPWLNEAVRLYEEGIGTIEEIDQVCVKAFGIGMGPFVLMNATGVPVAYHAEKTLEVFGPLYKAANLLRVTVEANQVWKIKEGEVKVSANAEHEIRQRMLGVVFFICAQLLEEKVCAATEINKGAQIGLKWRIGPCAMMKETGHAAVKMLVHGIAKKYNMPVPAMEEKDWKNIAVSIQKTGSTAIISFDTPQSLNALSEETVGQLGECVGIADHDDKVNTIFIVGKGKAFVAGADIKFFVRKMKSGKIDDIEDFTVRGQEIFHHIDNSKKKVVALVNGLTLGGGLELALCADIILATPSAVFAFPETGIGIYPGLGGTQRSVKKIGIGMSRYLIHTGKLVNAETAFQIGLVDKLITGHEYFSLLHGNLEVPAIAKRELSAEWKRVAGIFEKSTLKDLQQGDILVKELGEAEGAKMKKILNSKAPVALRLADQLILEQKGCDSELEHLHEVFNTSDALLGLTNIGSKVEFAGR